MHTRQITIRSGNGVPVPFTQRDWEAFVDLLDTVGADLEGIVVAGRLDGATARAAGAAIREVELEVVSTAHGERIHVKGGGDTDPITATTARVAEGLELTEVAEMAHRTLLAQAGSASGRPLNGDEHARVATWVALLTAGDDLYVER